MTQRYCASIAYLGSEFYGSTIQKDFITVQGVLNKALNLFINKTNKIHTVFSSRTDAGVHAIDNRIHFDLPYRPSGIPFSSEILLKALPTFINKVIRSKGSFSSIQFNEIIPVNHDFHARFDAKGRRYIYKIIHPIKKLDRKHYVKPKSILFYPEKTFWYFPYPLNIEKMIHCSKYLIGKHDFSSFRGARCNATSPIKTIHNIEIKTYPYEDKMLTHFNHNSMQTTHDYQVILITIEAPSFLYHMVRNIIGGMVMIGEERINKKQILHTKLMKTWLDNKNRMNGPPLMAPASGLYLINVFY